jgi:hypothetical protein
MYPLYYSRARLLRLVSLGERKRCGEVDYVSDRYTYFLPTSSEKRMAGPTFIVTIKATNWWTTTSQRLLLV